MHDNIRRYAPDRFTWVPGEPWGGPLVHYGEAGTIDRHQLRELFASAGMNVSERRLTKWLGQTGFVVRVAKRNQRVIVGFMVSEHVAGLNRAIGWYVTKEYRHLSTFQRLAKLCCLELPEARTIIPVHLSDEKTACQLRSLGWKVDTFHDDTIDFTHPPASESVRRGRDDSRQADRPPRPGTAAR